MSTCERETYDDAVAVLNARFPVGTIHFTTTPRYSSTLTAPSIQLSTLASAPASDEVSPLQTRTVARDGEGGKTPATGTRMTVIPRDKSNILQ